MSAYGEPVVLEGSCSTFPFHCPACEETSWRHPGDMVAEPDSFDERGIGRGPYKVFCCGAVLTANQIGENKGSVWWKALEAEARKAERREIYAATASATKEIPS